MSKLKELNQQVYDLVALCKRLAYNCPIQYISDTFFRLYTLHKSKMESLATLFTQKGSLTFSLPEQTFKETTGNDESTPKIVKDMQRMQYKQISEFLFCSQDHKNSNYRELRPVSNLPMGMHTSPSPNPQTY